MKRVNWKVTKADAVLINQIAKRAVRMAKEVGHEYPFMDAEMDITAAHLNGCPLKLAELLGADDFNFSHDVFGIYRHINRADGQLMDCFVPRYARPEKAA